MKSLFVCAPPFCLFLYIYISLCQYIFIWVYLWVFWHLILFCMHLYLWACQFASFCLRCVQITFSNMSLRLHESVYVSTSIYSSVVKPWWKITAKNAIPRDIWPSDLAFINHYPPTWIFLLRNRHLVTAVQACFMTKNSWSGRGVKKLRVLFCFVLLVW